MTHTIDSAVRNFCTNIINLHVEPAKHLGDNLYGAAIAIFENNQETQWYLLFKKDTLNEFAKVLLCEDSLAEDELNDLVKEVANLIIGSAKVMLEHKDDLQHYKIGVPDYLGHVDNAKLLELEEILLYKVKNRTFAVGKRTQID
jgi:chemotaxis protein CheY-P-specific phosphatase CheC